MNVVSAFVGLFLTVLYLYKFVLIAAVILSWLTAFNVVNLNNQAVRQVAYFLAQLTEPALQPIRRFLPNFGGIDLSPIVLILLIQLLEELLRPYR